MKNLKEFYKKWKKNSPHVILLYPTLKANRPNDPTNIY